MDVFVCQPPHAIHFSGGRTSAYMLRRHLDAHGGRLPDGVQVVFCNTGKEREETLDFVERCSLEWDVPVVWLEYRCRPDGDPIHGFEVVNYATASRNGEPFSQAISSRRYLPNVVARFCTVELKIRTAQRYLKRLGWSRWTQSIGLRADEPARVARLIETNRHNNERPIAPLDDADVDLAEVQAYWAASPFDLALLPHEGNCDLCFLKGRGKLQQIMRDRPDLAAWWIAQEELVRSMTGARRATFRDDRPNYATLLKQVQEQPLLPFVDDAITDCFCGPEE